MFRVNIQVDLGDHSGRYDVVGDNEYVNVECRLNSGKYTRKDRNYHSSFSVHRIIPLLEENLGYEFNQYRIHEVYRNGSDWTRQLMAAGYMDSNGSFNEDYHTIDGITESMIVVPFDPLRLAFNNYMDSLYKPKKVVLEKSEYNKLVTVVRGTKKLGKELDLTCGICLDEVKVGNKWAITKCNHVFHPKCIKRWLTKECIHPKCPMCNTDVRD